jgi:AcrR family transcriptional regulator
MDEEIINIRKKIIGVAMSLFVAQGYDGASMREIAESCGITKAGLYYHFTDKQDLFLAVLDDQLNELGKILNRIEALPGKTKNKVRAFLQTIFSQSADQRAIILLASQDMQKVGAEERAKFNQLYQTKFLNRIAAILDAGIAAGELRSHDTLQGVWALLGLMYPYLHRSFNDPDQLENSVDFLNSVFFDGISSK